MAATKTRKLSAATLRKQAAVEAYTKEFGTAPTGRFTAKSLESRVQSREFSRTRMAQQDRIMDRLLVGEKPASTASTSASAAKPAAPAASTPASSGGWRMQPGREPGADARRDQRLWRGYKSEQVVKAIAKAPPPTFKPWLDNRFNDRPAAAKTLRDYRSSLGRGAPSTLSSATAQGKGGEFAATKIGKGIQKLNPYRTNLGMPDAVRMGASFGFGVWAAMKIEKGYAFGGMKGALRETVDASTFGLGGKAFDKVFGESADWEGISKTLGLESPAQTAAGRRAEMINKRPTKAARNWLDKQDGRPRQKDVPSPNETRDLGRDAHSLAGGLVGMAGGAAVAGTTIKLQQGLNAAGQALVKAAPMLNGVGKLATRAVPLLALAAGAYAVGSRALEGYRDGGASGAVKGAAAGAASFATFGASDALMSQYREANASYQGRQAAVSGSGGNGVQEGGRGWAHPKVQAAAQAALGRVYRGPQS